MAAPHLTAKAWAEMAEVPPAVGVALAALAAAPTLETMELHLPALARGDRHSPAELLERFAMISREFPDWEPHQVYHDLVPEVDRAPHQPSLPQEAWWAVTTHAGMGKDAEGRTLRSEMLATLELCGVTDDSVRIETVGYWQAMDDALRAYRAALLDAHEEKRLAAEREAGR